jgi:hypothetical protein
MNTRPFQSSILLFNAIKNGLARQKKDNSFKIILQNRMVEFKRLRSTSTFATSFELYK